jgi:hypothetical protein
MKTKNLRPGTFRIINSARLLSRMALRPEAAQVREKARVLIQKFDGTEELTDFQLYTIISYIE